jgi:GT2 family glycosyltransferase
MTTISPQIDIAHPLAPPARQDALTWIAAYAKPREGFVGASIHVDGAEVPSTVRLPPEQVMLTAWCDTRGLPPGVHEVAVTGRWEGHPPITATKLVVVSPDEAVAWQTPATGDAAVTDIARVGEPRLLETLARATLGDRPVIVLADDATLAPDAQERIARAFASGEVDLVIGDEATPTGEGTWVRWRKRGFSPEGLPAIDLVGPLLALSPRAADVLCDELPAEPSLYACALALLDRGLSAHAIPDVLAFTPEPRLPIDDAAGRAAVQRLAERRARPVHIATAAPGVRDVRWSLVEETDVVAVVASRTPELAERCLAGLAAERTGYGALRAVLVDSGEDPDAMRRVADAASRPTEHVRYPEDAPFNYQRAMNLGVAAAGAEYVLLLNDDVTPLTPEWLTRMVELGTLPGVGVVGARLHYPDGRIQHAGVKVGEMTAHLYHEAPGDAVGHRFELLVPSNPEAVTGACMLARREALAAVDGFDERYVQLYGDVDLCYRVAHAGWRIAWCAGAVLEHAESATYGVTSNPADTDRFMEEWQYDPAAAASTRVPA